MATLSQIRKIHTLKTAIGMDTQEYRELLSSFDVQSSKNLTYTEAIIFIEVLEEKAVKHNVWTKYPKKYEDLSRNEEMATASQLRMIEGLWRELSFIDSNDFAKKSLRKFLHTKFKIDDVIFLTKCKANKVINAILRMKKNIKKSAAALDS